MIKKIIVNEMQVDIVYQDNFRLSKKIISKSVVIINQKVYRLYKEKIRNSIKNNVGSFYNADKTIISKDFLKTLSEKDIKNNWAERIKIALFRKSRLYFLLLEHDLSRLKNIISKS